MNLVRSPSNLQCDDKHSSWRQIGCKVIFKLAKINKSSVMGESVYS